MYCEGAILCIAILDDFDVSVWCVYFVGFVIVLCFFIVILSLSFVILCRIVIICMCFDDS